ncbi:MAG: HEAT repeat domain-containing protein [Syntrophaceae bacterium]|nr:HEAT repeat domain-containing protein [Syntrophaceae bacterium]
MRRLVFLRTPKLNSFTSHLIVIAIILACVSPIQAQAPKPSKGPTNAIDQHVNVLLRDLNSPNPSVATNAISELRDMKLSSKDSLPALISALKSQSEFVRLGVINTIAEFGAEAEPAMPALVAALADKDSLVREAAILAIMAVGKPSKNSISELANLLGDDNKKTRDAAVTALASFGPESLPVLIKSLEGKNPQASKSASEALARIGAPAVNQLVAILKNGGIGAENASSALVTIGKPSVPPLIKLLKDSSSEVSKKAAEALKALGAIATPDLIEALRSKN